ncbi:MAG: hypothetical protein GX542_07705 [Rhodococcus sp.]|nr:hypothetical protein [Rhodococcus sp. (in: high G+C Gram-positive bacteria)]
MAKNAKNQYVDPGWPEVAEGDHAVSELVSNRAGNLSPYGEYTQFPVPVKSLPYVHPHTIVNR